MGTKLHVTMAPEMKKNTRYYLNYAYMCVTCFVWYVDIELVFIQMQINQHVVYKVDKSGIL